MVLPEDLHAKYRVHASSKVEETVEDGEGGVVGVQHNCQNGPNDDEERGNKHKPGNFKLNLVE